MTYLVDTNFLCSCCNGLWSHCDCKKTTFEERYYNNSWYLCNHNIHCVPHVVDQSHETCLNCGQFHEQLTELCQQRLTVFHSLKMITPCFCKCYSSKQFQLYRMWLCRNTNKPTSWLCLYYFESGSLHGSGNFQKPSNRYCGIWVFQQTKDSKAHHEYQESVCGFESRHDLPQPLTLFQECCGKNGFACEEWRNLYTSWPFHGISGYSGGIFHS